MGSIIPMTVSSDFMDNKRRVGGNGLHKIRSGNVLYSLNRLKLAVRSFPCTVRSNVFILNSSYSGALNGSVRRTVKLSSIVARFRVASGETSYLSVANLTERTTTAFSSGLIVPRPTIGGARNSMGSFLSIRVGRPSLYCECTNTMIRGIHIGPSPH